MSWIQTYTGKRFDPLNPKIDDICLEDIGHALMYQCRFAGHCTRHYSVLEHTLRLTDLVSPENKRWALIHDASEAYISDIVRPVKHLPQFSFYREIEENLMQRICDRFDLPYEQPDEVTDADKAMLWWEYQALFDHHLPEWKKWEAYGLKFPHATFERRGWNGGRRDGADELSFFREASIWGLK